LIQNFENFLSIISFCYSLVLIKIILMKQIKAIAS